MKAGTKSNRSVGGGGTNPGRIPSGTCANATNRYRAIAGGNKEIVASNINRLCHSGRHRFATAAANRHAKVVIAAMGTTAWTRTGASLGVPNQCFIVTVATIKPANTIAVASEMPRSPSARCFSIRPRAASVVCATKRSVQPKKSAACTCKAGGLANVPRAIGSQYVSAKPIQAMRAQTTAIDT